MKQTIEQYVDVERFSMPTLANHLGPLLAADIEMAGDLAKIKAKFSDGHYTSFIRAVLRNVFLIELVKVPKIETTKVRYRWFDQLDGDPRGCTFDDCLTVARGLVNEVADNWLDNEQRIRELKLFFDNSLLPYEAPIDYATHDRNNFHRPGNIIWSTNPVIIPTLKLREYLTAPGSNQNATVLKKAVDDKIKIKTYLTDRALTGAHKTNREKRWEAHPSSVQFSMRTECLRIEHLLIIQLCGFEGFSQDIIADLREKGVLNGEIEQYCCPVTQIPMSWAEFKDALLNPQHGKSSFQVGHLDPLKLKATGDETEFGHKAENIGWISSDGNRIQGSLSLDETRELLKTIAQNYEQRGWV